MSGLSLVDWTVLLGTLLAIVAYGTYKTRKNRNLESYLKGGNSLGWGTIGLSVMATQASAITFISTPGQAFESGMGFVQNYFGLPFALIVVSAVFIPIYYRLKVFTAYEYLEERFNKRTRLLTAGLFLIQRGLAAGITIYAPAIILSSVLNWNLNITIIVVGLLVIVYTVSGGTKAVSITQQYQMGVIFLGMFIAFFVILNRLPEGVGVIEAMDISGKMGKLNALNFDLDIKERYTFWSGITGGFFLALSYFGTDQSQVQRYLSGKNIRESRIGLMFNAVLKIPMQYFILFTGVMVFVFFQFEKHDLLFDATTTQEMRLSENASQFTELESKADAILAEKKIILQQAMELKGENDLRYLAKLKEAESFESNYQEYRSQAKELVRETFPDHSTKDSDYVFLSFIMNYLPKGLIGLLLAVIISAAMSSTAGELNALGSTSTIDFYKRIVNKDADEKHAVFVSKMLTLFWGILAIAFALFAHLVENLIEAVNILGSVFYGTILGVFVVAFALKWIQGRAIFIAAILAQICVFVLFAGFQDHLSYLFFNLIGCAAVVIFAMILQPVLREKA